MRFTGTVLAVLVANLLTICLLAGAYFYLKSDHGQMMLYNMGLHSFFMASLVSPRSSSEPAGPASTTGDELDRLLPWNQDEAIPV